MPTTPLGRRTKDDLSLDRRLQLVVVRPVFTYWQAPLDAQPKSLHSSLLRAAVNVLDCVDRVLGRRVGCVLGFLFLFLSRKEHCSKLGFLFSVQFIANEQLWFLLALQLIILTFSKLIIFWLMTAHTHFVKWNYSRTLPVLVAPLCNPCGNIHKAQQGGDDMSIQTAASGRVSCRRSPWR